MSCIDLVDVKKEKQKSPDSKRLLLAVATVLGLSLLVFFAKSSFNSVSLARKDILIGTVQLGEMKIIVDGYGTLKSNQQKILTPLTNATVSEIVLKPGATVTRNSVIIRLINPELAMQVESAEQELAQRQANLRQLVVNQKRDLLLDEAELSDLVSQHETAELRVAAEQQLLESGTVSALAFQESASKEQQLRQRIGIYQRRIEQLSTVHREALRIQEEQIKQQQGVLETASDRVNKLNVVAGIDGVLQRLSVELGQSVAAGEDIALVGSTADLIALIQVPRGRAADIVIGQGAIIDTRQDKIDGEVIRIDPVVEDNTVTVEIALPADLPRSAIPQQNVNAQIVVGSLPGVLFMERPANVQGNDDAFLYKLNSTVSSATRTAVKFGRLSSKYAELTFGAEKGDQFIISNLENYTNNEIEID